EKLLPKRKPSNSKVTPARSFADAASGSSHKPHLSPSKPTRDAVSRNTSVFETTVLQKLDMIAQQFSDINTKLDSLADRVQQLEDETYSCYEQFYDEQFSNPSTQDSQITRIDTPASSSAFFGPNLVPAIPLASSTKHPRKEQPTFSESETESSTIE